MEENKNHQIQAMIKQVEDFKQTLLEKDGIKNLIPQELSKSTPDHKIEFLKELLSSKNKIVETLDRREALERINKFKRVKIINEFLRQYLDGYVVIAVDPSGDDVAMMHFGSQRDHRAVHSLLQDYMSGRIAFQTRSADGEVVENPFEDDMDFDDLDELDDWAE